jgi:hypothetical protein
MVHRSSDADLSDVAMSAFRAFGAHEAPSFDKSISRLHFDALNKGT